MRWSYESFYDWYSNTLQSFDDPVLVYVYEAKQPSKKDAGRVEPFITSNIRYAGVCPVEGPKKLFPNGVSVLLEQEPRYRQWMFLVFPSEQLTADHFSFVADRNDKCHLHRTVYKPVMDNGHIRYVRLPTADYLPMELDLPRIGTIDEWIKQPENQPYKPFLLDVMRFPWIQSSPLMAGGAKRRKQPQARPVISPDFVAAWEQHRVSNVEAIGIRRGERVYWSVAVRHQGQRRWTSMPREAIVFDMPADATERDFQEALAGRLA